MADPFATFRLDGKRGMAVAGRGGVIVNTSSQMGHVGGTNRVPFCAAKYVVEGMTKAMALALAPHGIRVVAIAPTRIETEMARTMFGDPATLEAAKSCIPLGVAGQPSDAAAARLVTDTSLRVDGGGTAR